MVKEMTDILQFLQNRLSDITLEPQMNGIYNDADKKIAIDRIKLMRGLAFDGLKAIKEYEEMEKNQLKLF